LRSLLANGLGGAEIHLLDAGAEAFPGTMTTTAITAFRIARRPLELRLRRVETTDGLDPLAGGRVVDWSQLGRAPRWSILARETPEPPPGIVELGELCRSTAARSPEATASGLPARAPRRFRRGFWCRRSPAPSN
jgi:hypothetical protein